MRSCANPFLGSLSSIQCQWCPRFQWRLGSFERWPSVSAQPLDRGRIPPLSPGVRQSNGAGGSQLRLGRVISFLCRSTERGIAPVLPGVRKPPKSARFRGFFSERYWDRTSDLFRVREARYRCANRSSMCRSNGDSSRWRRDLNPCGRLCRPLPRLSATPPRVTLSCHVQ